MNYSINNENYLNQTETRITTLKKTKQLFKLDRNQRKFI